MQNCAYFYKKKSWLALSVLCALISMSMSVQAATATFGYTSIGAIKDTGDANYINAWKFRTSSTQSGTIVSMSVYVSGPVSAASNNQFQVAIYSDAGGVPGSLIAASASKTISPNAWNTAALSGSLLPNTSYWLAYNTNGIQASDNNVPVGAAGSGQQVWRARTFGSWPSTFGAVQGSSSNPGSIYVAYNPGAGVSDTAPPSIPANLQASAASTMQINLSWSAATDNVGVTGYRVYRSGTQIGTTTSPSYAVPGLSPATAYSFTVAAYDAAGNVSGQSNVASASTLVLLDTTAPSVPSGLIAKAVSTSQINLSWSASTDNVAVTGYKLERCQGLSCTNFTQIATPTTTSFSNTSLAANTVYNYRVRATDAAGNLSNYSSAANVTTLNTPSQTSGSACNAPPLQLTGTRIVNISTESQLQSAVANAQTGDTIVLADGTYYLTSTLYLNGKNNVTIRGNSGCDSVILAGKGMDNASYGNVLFGIWSNSLNTAVAHLTIRDTYDNLIIFNSGAQSPHVYSVKLLNAGSQFIKSNPTDPVNGIGVDNGVIEYSWMEYTAGPPATNHGAGVGYTNGLSAHTADNWIIRNNLFKNFHTPDSAAYLWNPAVLMWNHSQNTVTEKNIFINVDRAIAYGLVDQAISTDHSGGTIRNNVVYLQPGLMSASRTASSDGAIIVWDSPNTKVYHNTILTNGNVVKAIEFRFVTTGGEARNNLADAPIGFRDGATFAQSGNYLSATTAMFVNPAGAELHLLDTTATRANVIDHGVVLPTVTDDIDGNIRPSGAGYDIGADEFVSNSQLPGADTTPPSVPQNLSATAASTSQINLSWSASTDNIGVTGYRVYRSGTQIGTATSPSYAVPGLSPATLYSFTAAAYDAAGNVSAQSNIAATNTLPLLDTTPPTVALTAPANGTTIAGTITASATASDNVGVVSIQFKLDGSNLGSADTSPPYAVTWDSTTVTNGTHVFTAVAHDAAGNTAISPAVTITVNNTSGNPASFQTSHDTIPNFARYPTLQSVQSGAWSNPATWNPARLPQGGDVVLIQHVVTYDSLTGAATTIGIASGGMLTFQTNQATTLRVGTLLVMPGGTLQVGTQQAPIAANVQANIFITNTPLNATLDPDQYGTGLLAFGSVQMHGAVQSPTFVRLSSEPRAGKTTLVVAQPVTGWRPGDQLILPDTRHLRWNEVTNWAPTAPQWEELTLQSVSADGQTLTLSSPLRFDHLGARDATGTLTFLPHVANLTRNVVVQSEVPNGTKGHVFFTHRAAIDVRYARFLNLGRTTTAPLNNASNHVGRYALHMHHVMGPQTIPSNGYQFTLLGNAIDGGSAPTNLKWGVAIHDSHYGLLQDNVGYNYGGAIFTFEDGSESYNMVDHNFAMRTKGTGDRLAEGTEGTGFWFRGPHNFIRNNVATNLWGDTTEAAYGFKFFMPYLGKINISNFPGADTSVAGQYTTQDGNKLPILEFSDNEVYGAAQGMTYWWVNSQDPAPYTAAQETVIKNLHIWHVFNAGVYHYPSAHVTFDGLVVRGKDPATSACCGRGWHGEDYAATNIVIRNADMQGMNIGVKISRVGMGPQTIENSYLRNVANVVIPTLGSANGGGWIPPRLTVLRNLAFAVWPGNNLKTILMAWDPWTGGLANTTQRDDVKVYQYQGNAADNFQAYYTVQATQNVAGGRAPCMATRPEIDGLLCPIAAPPSP